MKCAIADFNINFKAQNLLIFFKNHPWQNTYFKVELLGLVICFWNVELRMLNAKLSSIFKVTNTKQFCIMNLSFFIFKICRYGGIGRSRLPHPVDDEGNLLRWKNKERCEPNKVRRATIFLRVTRVARLPLKNLKLLFTYYLLLITLNMRVWRNWQTR